MDEEVKKMSAEQILELAGQLSQIEFKMGESGPEPLLPEGHAWKVMMRKREGPSFLIFLASLVLLHHYLPLKEGFIINVCTELTLLYEHEFTYTHWVPW